ncbi:Methylase of polypeptide chain release factors [Kingella potus]|uniref:Methylase of polypeptide chain release factors n=1 Tax=Kingella potus TaxID=265175 RepID=A0A377R2J0_9NEIS|nr:class I SAM-dependent methyltransferase [Kingella potus]UOP00247.1 methyltransferase domain-containing protein [Kingella potus]STR02696.1 Methylase of polypeptide chain release factors [Kingella potus]
MLLPALAFARSLLEGRLKNGGRALDGTAGNGFDTLLLARLVGTTGRVWAFDIQTQALENTRGRLKAAGAEAQVRLVCDSHANLSRHIAEPLDAAVFNFGYLPGGDKSLATRADTSTAALEAALSLLADGGILTAVLYGGHPQGAEESAAVQAWARNLPQERFHVLRYGFTNQRNCPPLLLAVEKRPLHNQQ